MAFLENSLFVFFFSVLDIYYEFMYNYVTILIDVCMTGIEINFFKINKKNKIDGNQPFTMELTLNFTIL